MVESVAHGDDWVEGYDDDDDSGDCQIDEYDLTATPNDFNVKTIFDYIEAGVIKIPSLQRNYVWEINRASKLIESLILGLPVPPIFLYEAARNEFLIIDGQQRLFSIFYFIKQRFPKPDKRVKLRRLVVRHGKVPDEVLHDDNYFTDFKLKLPGNVPEQINKFNRLQYDTLDSYKLQFELRPLRNVIVKQNAPKNDDSSIYEIFNRLNSGGVNLSRAEIRVTLYPSAFYNMLYQVNELPEWKRLLCQPEPSLRGEDVEILLRGFAFLIEGDNYTSPLDKFLNQFAKQCQSYDKERSDYLKGIFTTFLGASVKLPEEAFFNKSNRFNTALFEAVFRAVCWERFQNNQFVDGIISYEKIKKLKNDEAFLLTLQKGGTMSKANVTTRLQRATEIVGAL